MITLKQHPFETLSLRVLGTLHRWSARRYRRAMLRRELARIGRQIAGDKARQHVNPR